MKRFWNDVRLREAAGGWSVALDDRPLKTPARATLEVRERALAEAIADEWRACGDEIDPRAMPLTGLANAAIDHVVPAPERFAADLSLYAAGDLLCYRAEAPPKLVAAQAAAWDPLLDWARRQFEIEFALTSGIIHVPQPAATVERLRAEVAALEPFRLAALSPIVTIGGSLIAGLAAIERAVAEAVLWDAISLDERWQIEQWGADDDAVASLAHRRADFAAAMRFLELLG